ncbi:MAG: exo-beta-N-acetylmuramidase NamZ domain-containing protein, partial [Bryobacteraceae bacterium]
ELEPLGMRETMFQPPASLRGRIAPTEGDLRGVVHDPTTRFMGGIAGHAGLFSTADDLARFAQMLLRGGAPVFSAAALQAFTQPQSPAGQPILRGLGWDIDSPYSGNRGELYPVGSFGHTGFTGTSMWIDPRSQSFVILLANSVHPTRRPVITPLRSRVATIAAAALGIAAPDIVVAGYNETLAGAGLRRAVARNDSVLTGLDVLAARQFAPLKGRKVGLITNHTGVDREGRRNVDRMLEAGVAVVSMFSPEHGMLGADDHEKVPHASDPATGIKVWSLYADASRRPRPEMLREIDVLVFDIQDAGTRFYTYVTTMAYAMEEAAKARLPIFVLDRPNPITGVRVEGPILDKQNQSFIGYFPLPVRHGMTVGELAKMFNGENRIGADLTVVEMKQWLRGDWFDSTGLAWIDPSPNLRGLTAALLFPAIGILEFSKNYSVGRGTATPFEVIGADFIRGRDLAAYLNRRQIPGLRVYPTRFQPASSHFAGQTIEGVRLIVTDREVFDTSRAGLEVAAAIEKLHPGRLTFEDNRRLIGSEAVIAALKAGEDPRLLHQRLEEQVQDFLKIRARYLIYK